MGILMERLEKGQNYWVAELPTYDTPFQYPQLLKLTDISFDYSRIADGTNYECTYEFGDIHIPVTFNNEMKCYMAYIGNFLVFKESSKLHEVIRNHVNPELYKNKKIDESLDINSIKAYIMEVDKNYPERLI